MENKTKILLVSLLITAQGLLGACATTNNTVRSETQETAAPVAGSTAGSSMVTKAGSAQYFIQPGDELSIKFFYNPELNEDVVVRPDGKISLQLVDEVQAGGKTPAQLDQELTQKYSVDLKTPAITVIMRSFGGQQVFVGGEVGEPQSITMTPNMSLLQAVMSAGGFLDTAARDNVLIIRAGPDNQAVSLFVNLEEAISGNSPEGSTQLQPADIIFVPKTGIARANVWVDQYIRQLLMFRGWSYSYRK
jgi:protein involved in polysaccharide export with SLBB domain